MIGAANLFSGSKAPSRIEQFVPKRDQHLTVRTLGSKRDYQSVPIPPKAGSLNGIDVGSIRPQVVFVLDRIAPGHKRRLVVKRRLAVLDSPDTASHSISARAESTGLSV